MTIPEIKKPFDDFYSYKSKKKKKPVCNLLKFQKD